MALITDRDRLAVITEMLTDLRRREEAKPYELSLVDFIGYMWPVVEPATPFVRGWTIDALCEHLTAVTDGEINRLLINVPPGFTKSLITDVFWPAWEWGPRRMPHLRYLCASYAQHLTVRDNERFRNIVINSRYTHHWGEVFHLSSDNKIKLSNDRTGWKFATSVGGVTGGERGDRVIIDDPNNPQDTESPTVRNGTNHWFIEVVPDRLNNIGESAIVIIQQRLHEEDVSGMAIAEDLGYTHLMIPMEYDIGRHCVTSIGWEDPRGVDADGESLFSIDQSGRAVPRDNEAARVLEDERDGMLAWPERFSRADVETLRKKGDYAYAGQYQQMPVPRGGGIFKVDWWMPWNPANRKFPPLEFILAGLDSAYTEKEENDPSALTVWGVFRNDRGEPKIILVDAWQKRLELHGRPIPRHVGESDESYSIRSQPGWGLVEWVAHTCRRFKVDRLLIESKASGISVAQEIRRLYGNAAWGVQLVDPKGDKVARAHAISHLFSEGMIYAPCREGEYTDRARMVIDQAATFPKATHDDLVDTMTMSLRWLRDNGLAIRADEVRMEEEEAQRFRPRSKPLYPA